MAGSRRPPTSFTISAPAARAPPRRPPPCRCRSRSRTSITGASFRITGSTRAISSSAGDRLRAGPGRFAPDIDDIRPLRLQPQRVCRPPRADQGTCPRLKTNLASHSQSPSPAALRVRSNSLFLVRQIHFPAQIRSRLAAADVKNKTLMQTTLNPPVPQTNFPPFSLSRLLRTVFNPIASERVCILIDLPDPARGQGIRLPREPEVLHPAERLQLLLPRPARWRAGRAGPHRRRSLRLQDHRRQQSRSPRRSLGARWPQALPLAATFIPSTRSSSASRPTRPPRRSRPLRNNTASAARRFTASTRSSSTPASPSITTKSAASPKSCASA